MKHPIECLLLVLFLDVALSNQSPAALRRTGANSGTRDVPTTTAPLADVSNRVTRPAPQRRPTISTRAINTATTSEPIEGSQIKRSNIARSVTIGPANAVNQRSLEPGRVQQTKGNSVSQQTRTQSSKGVSSKSVSATKNTSSRTSQSEQVSVKTVTVVESQKKDQARNTRNGGNSNTRSRNDNNEKNNQVAASRTINLENTNKPGRKNVEQVRQLLNAIKDLKQSNGNARSLNAHVRSHSNGHNSPKHNLNGNRRHGGQIQEERQNRNMNSGREHRIEHESSYVRQNVRTSHAQQRNGHNQNSNFVRNGHQNTNNGRVQWHENRHNNVMVNPSHERVSHGQVRNSVNHGHRSNMNTAQEQWIDNNGMRNIRINLGQETNGHARNGFISTNANGERVLTVHLSDNDSNNIRRNYNIATHSSSSHRRISQGSQRNGGLTDGDGNMNAIGPREGANHYDPVYHWLPADHSGEDRSDMKGSEGEGKASHSSHSTHSCCGPHRSHPAPASAQRTVQTSHQGSVARSNGHRRALEGNVQQSTSSVPQANPSPRQNFRIYRRAHTVGRGRRG